MTLGEKQLSVSSGNTICISPNTPHQISNTGKIDLKFLRACRPAYSHQDTVLI